MALAHIEGGVGLYRVTRLVRYQRYKAMPPGTPVQPAPKRMEPAMGSTPSGPLLHSV